MSDIIDINITPIVETITLTIEPNLTTININTINGGGGAVDSVNGQTGVVVLDQDDIADGTTYKQYSLTEKNKLAGIQDGAEVNVNADWNAVSGDAQILNKPTIPSITGLVPYTGAISDVNLGEFGLLTGNIEFDNTPTNIPTNAGSTYWNDTDGTLDLILKGGNVKLQIGQEQVVRVVNKTATNIDLLEANYQAVRVTGSQGQRLKVDLAQATNDLLSAETIGLVTENIVNNQEGFITTSGLVRNINTTGSLQGETWADGDIIYLSPTVAGNLTKVKPVAPNHLVIIGYVIYAHITQGTIFVKVNNGYELDELHNVLINTPLNNQPLVYETSTQVWKNKTIIEDTIVDGITDKAPSQNAVFDALALKQNLLGYTPYRFIQTSQTATTGTTAETLVATATINGATFNTSDVMKVLFGINKTGTGGVYSIRLRINTTNTLVGATQVALFTSAGTSAQMSIMNRSFSLNGGNLYGYSFSGNALTDIASIGGALSSTAYNTANTLYFFWTVQLANAGDSIIPNLTNLTN